MKQRKVCGIIGITDEGQPLVTADHQCPHFAAQAALQTAVRECRHCKFSDFRKSCELTLQQSICRCPQNRVAVTAGGKNEQAPAPLFETLVSNIKGGVITCIFHSETQSSTAVYLNAGWTAITGYTLEELNRDMGGNPQALVYPADKASADLEYKEQVRQGNEYALLYRVVRKNGATIWVIDRGVVSTLPNGDVQNQSIVTEVTEIKEQEQRLQQLAQLDQLTGIYNKVTFSQQAQLVLARQCANRHAMLLLDVDDFKQVNDNWGHVSGDGVLAAVGGCLRHVFRSWDVLGRIGGDEFMVLLTDIPNEEYAVEKAEELRRSIGGLSTGVFVTVSIGIALSDADKDYETLFRQADTALYRAKNRGKNQCCLFSAQA